jgi:hypothetical protein
MSRQLCRLCASRLPLRAPLGSVGKAHADLRSLATSLGRNPNRLEPRASFHLNTKNRRDSSKHTIDTTAQVSGSSNAKNDAVNPNPDAELTPLIPSLLDSFTASQQALQKLAESEEFRRMPIAAQDSVVVDVLTEYSVPVKVAPEVLDESADQEYDSETGTVKPTKTRSETATQYIVMGAVACIGYVLGSYIGGNRNEVGTTAGDIAPETSLEAEQEG